MKKILILAICAATATGAFAQKQAVADAKKLSGKLDKIEDARALIKGAMENPETANDPQTYVVAGNIEWDAYDKARALQMINPEDPAVNPGAMAEQLLNGYQYFLKALPLDSLPNEKGQVKPKFSKNIQSKIAAHANEFFTAGANAFNDKKYYPEAYDAFIIFANMPGEGIDQATRATAFFNAGLGAYAGNEVRKAADAFYQARKNGYEDEDCYIRELASWQNLAGNDPSLEAEAQEKIFEVAKAGYEKFGNEKPIFISNLVNCLMAQKKDDDAIALVTNEIASNPEAANLYSLRGFVEERKGDLAAAEADYRKIPTCNIPDFEAQKSSVRFMLKRGQEMWNEVEGNTDADNAVRKNVYENYWKWAQEVGENAYKLKGQDDTLDSYMERIDYLIDMNKNKF